MNFGRFFKGARSILMSITYGTECVYRALSGHSRYIIAFPQGDALGCHPEAFHAECLFSECSLAAVSISSDD